MNNLNIIFPPLHYAIDGNCYCPSPKLLENKCLLCGGTRVISITITSKKKK
jgi:hypothetical protein